MTDEQRRKVRWLNRVRRASRNARYWFARVKDAENRAERTTRGAGAANTGRNINGTENAFADYAEIKAKYENKLAKLKQLRNEVKTVIENIDDDELQAVLYWHYIRLLTWEQVAEKMHYSDRTIKRKHIKALDKIVT